MQLNFLTDELAILFGIEDSRLDLLEPLECLIVHIEVLERFWLDVGVFAAGCMGARVLMMLEIG